MAGNLVVGVDVGGTNTDVAILRRSEVVGWAKVSTTEDVTQSVKTAIAAAISHAAVHLSRPANVLLEDITRVNIGTTHFINAVVRRRDLAKVCVVRLCGPASVAVPPFIDFPSQLRKVVEGNCYLIEGGYQFDGQEITAVARDEVLEAVQSIRNAGHRHVVISGIFSPVQPKQELEVKECVIAADPTLSITLSHELGQIGLLERENASILNESLKPLAWKTIQGFKEALEDLNLTCPFYLTQNDGTIISGADAQRFPVHTFSSGATNSMRGAAFLSGLQDGIIIDIGGTSSDIGVLKHGFPREAAARVKIGGVNTNFRMPDVLSLGLGGGSLVRRREKDGKVCIGPDSVGYRLTERAMVFGGNTLTATDVVVAQGLADIGDRSLLALVDVNLVQDACKEIRVMLENGIDAVKVSQGDCPVCLVGGGSILIDTKEPLLGVSRLEKPPYYQVANAVGAAMGQISGSFDRLVAFAQSSRDQVIEQAKEEAIRNAVNAGALPETIQVLDIVETPMTYVTVPVTRLKIKVVGDLYKYDLKVDLSTLYEKASISGSEGTGAVQHVQGEKTAKDHESPSKGAVGITEMPTVEVGIEAPSECTSPKIDQSSGEWLLNKYDVECCAIGCGILGCGGGGSPYLGRLMALRSLEQGHQIRVINPMRLQGKKGKIVTLAYMGAPVILIEKLFGRNEVLNAFHTLAQVLQSELPETHLFQEGDVQGIRDVDSLPRLPLSEQEENKVLAVMSGEIGGCNGMVPLLAGAELGLPVVDCDGMGRAFPKLNQFAPFMHGCSPFPACLTDERGSVAAVAKVPSPQALEDYFRIKTIQFGCSAVVNLGALTPEEMIEKSCLYSISRAWRIGNAVLKARQGHTNPVTAILEQEHGELLISGKVVDVRRVTEKGFNFGHVLVEGTEDYKENRVKIDFQNENLIVRDNNSGRVLVTCPDLITIVDSDLGDPIMTEEVRYGLRVSVLTLPTVPLMRSEEALKHVGPGVFGYEDLHYVPRCTFVEQAPIPPS